MTEAISGLHPFLGMYYVNSGSDKGCPAWMNLMIVSNGSRVFLADVSRGIDGSGVAGIADIGFGPEIQNISAGSVVSDAGSVGDRTTTFSINNNIYSVVDTFMMLYDSPTGPKRVPKSNTLELELLKSNLEKTNAILKVTRQVLEKPSITCQYYHSVY
jgi:hypothetical protein